MILVYVVVYLWVAIGLSVLTDGVFSDILDKLGSKWNLPKQIVAATLMAMASSGPELFTSVVDTFWFKNMIGIGTIIGSAIFNILIIVGAAAFFASEPLKLDWKPIVRDVSWYCLVSLVLLGTNLSGENTVWNMWTLVSVYIFYILYLINETRSTRKSLEIKNQNKKQSKRSWTTLVTVFKAKQKLLSPKRKSESNDISIDIDALRDEIGVNSPTSAKSGKPQSEVAPKKSFSCYKFVKCVLFDSWDTLFNYTCPSEKYLGIGFMVCVIWIIIFTYVLVLCCNAFASSIGIPPILAGLLLLAPTTSLPDAMASIVMAKQGEGDSAVVNALSSNIFDIAIGHGLPHFINCFTGAHPYSLDKSGVRSYIALVISLVVFCITLRLCNWTLDRRATLIFVLTYGVYVVLEIMSVDKGTPQDETH